MEGFSEWARLSQTKTQPKCQISPHLSHSFQNFKENIKWGVEREIRIPKLGFLISTFHLVEIKCQSKKEGKQAPLHLLHLVSSLISMISYDLTLRKLNHMCLDWRFACNIGREVDFACYWIYCLFLIKKGEFLRTHIYATSF